MKEFDAAKSLAQLMVQIGKDAKKQTVAVITDMNVPLGRAVGNAIEIKEALSCLKGEHALGHQRSGLCLGYTNFADGPQGRKRK